MFSEICCQTQVVVGAFLSFRWERLAISRSFAQLRGMEQTHQDIWEGMRVGEGAFLVTGGEKEKQADILSSSLLCMFFSPPLPKGFHWSCLRCPQTLCASPSSVSSSTGFK